MAHSIATYTGDGVTTDFLFDKPYIKEADVHGFVDEVDSAISFVDPTHIRFAVAPADGSPISIKRLTDTGAPTHAFPNRTYIKSENLDGNSTQQLYLHQETLDVTNSTVNAEQSAAEAAASAAAAQTSADDASNSASTSQASMLNAIAASVATAEDVLETDANVVLTSDDVALTHADVVLTHADVITTNQDTVDTANDLAATNQDTIDTAADVVLTHADVVLTGDDVLAAQTSADDAQQSAVDAGSVYLGAHAIAPTEDNYGNPLIVGSTYLNTTNDPQDMWVYTSTGWLLQTTSTATTASDVAVSDPKNVLVGANTELALAEAMTDSSSFSRVKNTDFRNDFVNWTDTSINTGSVAINTTDSISGTGFKCPAFTLNDSLDVAELESDFIDCEPDKSLQVNYQARTLSGGFPFISMFVDMYQDGVFQNTSTPINAWVASTTWTAYSAVLSKANVGSATQLKIRLRSYHFTGQPLPTIGLVDKLIVTPSVESEAVRFPNPQNNFSQTGEISANHALNYLAANHGTWHPELAGATTAGTGWTYGANQGTWHKVGNLLLITFYVSLLTKSVNSVGALVLVDNGSDLPSFSGDEGVGMFDQAENMTWDGLWKQIMIVAANDQLYLKAMGTAGSYIMNATLNLTDSSRVSGSVVINLSL